MVLSYSGDSSWLPNSCKFRGANPAGPVWEEKWCRDYKAELRLIGKLNFGLIINAKYTCSNQKLKQKTHRNTIILRAAQITF